MKEDSESDKGHSDKETGMEPAFVWMNHETELLVEFMLCISVQKQQTAFMGSQSTVNMLTLSVDECTANQANELVKDYCHRRDLFIIGSLFMNK